ncbi:MAG: response regulator [Gloeocapsa sp. DLM2.Bin57]|nr:MAG: response regulator [Gloeocapsa sp. DLM2.Bin57]
MSNPVFSLQDFLDPVVEITRDIDCKQLNQIFAGGINQAVVVNQERYPLGIIYARSLLARCLQRQSLSLTPGEINSLIEPITILPSKMSFLNYYTHFGYHLELGDSYCFALVDENNHLLGILNQGKIFKAIALHNLPEQNLLNLLEKLPLPVMLQTEQGRILAQNDQWRQQIGDYIPERLNPDYINKFPPQTLPQPTLVATREYNWEFCQVPLDRLDLTPADTNTEKLVWLVLANHLQQELASNRLKDEFVSGITHDLKSPLTSIIGLSNLLKEQKLGTLNPRQSRYVELIYQSGQRIMNLVNELLDLSRLQSGELEINLDLVNLQTICEQTAREIQAKLTEANLELSLVIETNIKNIQADSLRLRQMLIHLLDNSIKFTPPGQQIGLRVNLWRNWLAFTVWDTGMGIPRESQKMILQKYHPPNQIINQPTTKGLGLILTQRLTELHGGDLTFLSTEDKGSSFTILLPTDNNDGNNLVLLVEDNPTYLKEITQLLNSIKTQAIIARTGTEAIDKARLIKPDFIFLNPSISFLANWDVLTLLKSDKQTKHIPIILTIEPSEKIKDLGKKADGILTLPITKESLLFSLAKVNHKRSLTILYLYPGSALTKASDTELEWLIHTHASGLIKRILEADSLEQAELLAQFWEVDAIVFNGSLLNNRELELKELREMEVLARLPLITLDNETTKVANQISGLQVFPCLIPPEEENLDYLLEVIEIAVGIK